MKIHNIDLKYSNTKRGKIHTLSFTLLGLKLPIKFLAMRYESNSEKQRQNRIENEKANPSQVGSRANGTAGHDVPYASTKEGGRYAMREITDARENAQHGAALTQFYKKNNLNDGDLFLVPLYEPNNNKENELVAAPSPNPAVQRVTRPAASPARSQAVGNSGSIGVLGILKRLSLASICIEAAINSLSEMQTQKNQTMEGY